MPRTLQPGQSSRLRIVDALSSEVRTVFESATMLVEAPNWDPRDDSLVVNGDGLLWRLPRGAASLVPIPMSGVPEINNDHVVAPDGESVLVSGKDGHVYRVPAEGGEGVRLTADHPEGRGYKNYLHGVSADARTLSVVVGARPTPESTPEEWRTNVALVDTADGSTTFLTDDAHPDDGAEIAGDHVWFNTERFTDESGHAQLARIRVDGTGLERLVDSDTVDWFPHPAPDGSRFVYLVYGAGTQGHPADLPVSLRLVDLPGGVPDLRSDRELLRLFGGQGTLNVPSWSPDGRRLAFADYPISE